MSSSICIPTSKHKQTFLKLVNFQKYGWIVKYCDSYNKIEDGTYHYDKSVGHHLYGGFGHIFSA